MSDNQRTRGNNNSYSNAMNLPPVTMLPVQNNRSAGNAPIGVNNPWDLALVATRETNNILADLYFALFGSINSPTNWNRVFSQLDLVPEIGGVKGTVQFSTASNGDLLFTWQLGVNTDIIRITSKTRNTASEILEMIRSSASFICPGFRLVLTKNNYDAQFTGINVNTAINTFKGVTAQDTFIVDPNIDPDQYKDKRVDIPLSLGVDSHFSLVYGFINDAATATPAAAMYFNDVQWQSGGVFDRGNCF